MGSQHACLIILPAPLSFTRHRDRNETQYTSKFTLFQARKEKKSGETFFLMHHFITNAGFCFDGIRVKSKAESYQK